MTTRRDLDSTGSDRSDPLPASEEIPEFAGRFKQTACGLAGTGQPVTA